jgi:hypothetical protein
VRLNGYGGPSVRLSAREGFLFARSVFGRGGNE